MRQAREERDLKAFGKKLGEIRRAHGFTQESLAETVGMTAHSLALIEQGQRWPRLTTLHKIARGIGVQTKDLLDGLKQ